MPAHSPQLAPEPRGVGRALWAFSITGQLADAATTWHFPRSTGRAPRRNAHIGNMPVGRLFVVKAAWGAAGALAGDLVKRRAERRGQRWMADAAKALPIFTGGTGFYVAARNEIRLARART